MFTDLHLRENRPPTLLFIFSTPSFSPLTKAIRTFVYSLLISAKDSIGGPQHASSRVSAAPRRTRRYYSLDPIFFDRSSAASKTVEGPTRNEISFISFCDLSY